MSLIIRTAIEQDMAQCLDMARAFYATTHYGDIAPMDDDTVCDLIRHCTENGILLVAQVAGTNALIGMAALVLVPFTFNRNVRIAAEVAWYVMPNHERNGAGALLEEAARAEAKNKGAVMMSMYALETSPPHVNDYYLRIGYIAGERSYRKRL